jgi:hypothetical protein
MRTIDTSTGVTARVMRGSRGKAGVGHTEATTECQAPRGVGERCEVLVAVVNEAGDVFHRRLNEGGVHVLPSVGAGDRLDANELLGGKVGNREERLAVGVDSRLELGLRILVRPREAPFVDDSLR